MNSDFEMQQLEMQKKYLAELNIKFDQLLSISKDLNSELTLENFNRTIANKVMPFLSVEKGALYLYEPAIKEFHLAFEKGFPDAQKIFEQEAIGDSILAKKLCQPGENNFFLNQENFPFELQSDFYLINRLNMQNKLLGFLFFARETDEHFHARDLVYSQLLTSLLSAIINNIQLKNRLEQHTTTDPLTGLVNFYYLSQLLEHYYHELARYSTKFSLVSIAIDNFSQVIEKKGFIEGESIIKETALIILDLLRQSDICGRVGQTRFLMILPNTGEEGASIVRSKLSLQLRERFPGVQFHFLAEQIFRKEQIQKFILTKS